jgi:hypothetical protein
MPVVEVHHGPVVMGNDVGKGDAVFFPQPCGEGRATRNGRFLPSGFVELTNLDADARGVARSFVVGMLPGFVERQMLHGFLIVDGEVPKIIAALVPLGLGANLSFSQQASVRGGSSAGAGGAMNGDKARTQAVMNLTAELSIGNEILAQHQAARGISRGAIGFAKSRDGATSTGKRGETKKFPAIHGAGLSREERATFNAEHTRSSRANGGNLNRLRDND